MVPNFKGTSDPLEEVMQAHTENAVTNDSYIIENDPLDVYSRQELYDDQEVNPIYVSDREFDTLYYDLDLDAEEMDGVEIAQVNQSHLTMASSQTKVSEFVCTHQDKENVCLGQPSGKVKKTWYKKLFKTEPNIDPNHALDMSTYCKITEINSFSSTVIHGSYLHTPQFDGNPQILLNMNGTVTGYTSTGLPLNILIDTGCHKTLLNKKFYETHYSKHLKNFRKIPFLEKHLITVGNGQQITPQGMIAFPVDIQNHSFEFLSLIVDMLDDYDLVIGLEAAMQLECVYYLSSSMLEVKQRSIPLYTVKDVQIPPGLSSLLELTGNLPCTFSSGLGIIRVKPVDNTYSYNTIETEFVDQRTCIHVTNKSSKTVFFSQDIPLAFFDLRSIGYFEPTPARDMLRMRNPQTYVTSFTAMIDSSDYLNNHTQTMDTQDPYPWLETDDPRRFQSDRELLEQTIDLSKSCLTTTQRLEFLDVLEKYKDAFSLRDEIGLAPNIEVSLDLIDKTPFYIRPFAVKEDMKPKIDHEMDRLVSLGILKKGLSGYSSPAMAIPRKNSEIPRVVGDFRELNKRLVKLNMSFPLVRDCIQTIGASQCEVMSVVDLRDAYHTLRLARNSQKYTGITPYTGADTYQYQRLGMGLSVSPAIWQTFINSILKEIPNKNRHIAIMDDCLIHSKMVDHLQDIVNLFESLIKNGLKISPKKCQFFRTSLVYMGLQFLIHKGRPSVTPMKDKCDAIRKLEPPKTVRDCRKFCGMVNFLATFLQNLQEILIPIYNLTKKNVKFEWNLECQEAFENIKTKLSHPPILRMPDSSGMFRLMSDTSTLAAGAALYQYQGNAFYIVGYNSKKLPSAAQNYSVTELELFGLVINIYAFRQILTNIYFEVFCDHSAIPQILKGKKKLPTRRIQRLIEHLMPFNFSIQYLPGDKMHIADILSRLAGKDLEPQDKLIPITFNIMTRTNRQPTQPMKLFTAEKHKPSQLPPSYTHPSYSIPKFQMPSKQVIQITDKISSSRQRQRQKPVDSYRPSLSHPKTQKLPNRPPAMPIGILRTPLPGKTLEQKEVRKSLVNPNLQIPQILPALDMPPPDQKESLETYRPPDSSFYNKPLPVLKDAKEIDVFTRHIPKQVDIDKFLKVLKAKVIKSYDLPFTTSELIKEYPNSAAFSHIYTYITKNILPTNRRAQRIVIANAEHYIVANGILFRLSKSKTSFDSQVQCLLVIPEKFENTVFHMFHDSLLGAHYGPINTYYTIKSRYWMHNMFEKLERYVSSCEACQQQKQKRGKTQFFHPRIPLSYNPMSYISADIKYMPKGIYGYEFLLIAVCEITGFVVAIPLIRHDAISIAHALIDRIFLIFGPPKSLIVDEDRALSSKIMHFVLDALKINIKCISPYNHGSLKTERYIQTINNLITRHLKDKGKEWPLYVTSCCYGMNTYVSKSTGFSPYELVFLKKPPDILNLYFAPLQTVAKGYRDYCIKMRAKLENVSNFIMELKTFQQNKQALEKNMESAPPEIFSTGQLVYLLAPSAASLQTDTRKCRADYVGPLVINKVLDETHYILNDLESRVLCGVYHINRLKKAKLRTSSGYVTTYDELHNFFAESERAKSNPLPDVSPAAIAQSLRALNCYKSSPIQNCSCPKYMCTCYV